jgi:hypothetical protein
MKLAKTVHAWAKRNKVSLGEIAITHEPVEIVKKADDRGAAG